MRVNRWPLALACGLVTAVAIPLVPAGVPILLAAAAGAFWGFIRPSEAGSLARGSHDRGSGSFWLALWHLRPLLGYGLPERWMRSPRMVQVTACLTVLLASLTVMNTVATGTQLVLDARLGALVVAAIALWLRAPFLLVVILGALAAGLLR